jgi:hypothetical protein
MDNKTFINFNYIYLQGNIHTHIQHQIYAAVKERKWYILIWAVVKVSKSKWWHDTLLAFLFKQQMWSYSSSKFSGLRNNANSNYRLRYHALLQKWMEPHCLWLALKIEAARPPEMLVSIKVLRDYLISNHWCGSINVSIKMKSYH